MNASFPSASAVIDAPKFGTELGTPAAPRLQRSCPTQGNLTYAVFPAAPHPALLRETTVPFP